MTGGLNWIRLVINHCGQLPVCRPQFFASIVSWSDSLMINRKESHSAVFYALPHREKYGLPTSKNTSVFEMAVFVYRKFLARDWCRTITATVTVLRHVQFLAYHCIYANSCILLQHIHAIIIVRISFTYVLNCMADYVSFAYFHGVLHRRRWTVHHCVISNIVSNR